MDGWDTWETPTRIASGREKIDTALAEARAASKRDQQKYREVVWDRGMPQESIERVPVDDGPDWDEIDEEPYY